MDSTSYLYEEPRKTIVNKIAYDEIFDKQIGEYFIEMKDSLFPWGKKCIRLDHYSSNFCLYPGEYLYVKEEWKESNPTFNTLSKDMNADDFIEYLKDKGMNVCPIQR